MFEKLRSLKDAVDSALASDTARQIGDKAEEIRSRAAGTGRSIIGRGLQDKELLERTNAIHRECDRIATVHNTRMQTLSDYLEQELDTFRSTLSRVDNELLPICQRFFEVSAYAIQLSNSRNGYVSMDQYGLAYMNNAYADGTIDKTMLAKGLGTGLATTAGLVSTVIAFGSASTGTALAALHGGALYTATLAALGGGAVSAGGFGMMGGLVVLGSSVALPAVAVTSYLADKKIRKEYDKALARQQEVNEAMVLADGVYRQLTESLANLRAINADFRSFTDFFGDLLNMSVAAIDMEQEERYQEILRKAVLALNAFKSINLIKDEMLNPVLVDEMQEARIASDNVRAFYYGFYAGLSNEHQKLMDQYRRQKVSLDKLDKKYKTAQKRVEKVNQENRKLAQQHRQDQQRIQQQQLLIRDQQRQLDVVRQFMANEGWDLDDPRVWQNMEDVIMPVTEDIISSNESEVNNLRRRYRQLFSNFDEEVIASLAASDYLYGMLRDQREMDCSPILLPAFKAVEAVVREVLKNHGIKKPSQGWMLGPMCHAVEENSALWRDDFCDNLENIRQVRNRTAHPGGIEIFQVEQVRIILLKSDGDRQSLLEYLNEMME